MGAGNTVDFGISLICYLTSRCSHRCDCNLPRIFHINCDLGFTILGGYQATFDGKRPNARMNVTAVLGIANNRLIDKYLKKKIVDNNAIPFRCADHRNLAG